MPSISADAPELSLDDRLCLALYQASRSMTARYRPLLGRLGLTYPQYLVLVLLWQEGESTVGAIGTRLRLESSTLSPLLKRLDGMGLVRRRRTADDERAVLVSLTRQGRDLEARAAGVPDAICDATGLDDDEQAALVTRLRALAAELDSSSRMVAHD